MKSCLLVANPAANSGRAQHLIPRICHHLKQRGVEVSLVTTRPAPQTATHLRHTFLQHPNVDCVAYVGGDGTFADTARCILAVKPSLPMGMFPVGTANNHGKSFGLRCGAIEEHVDAMLSGDTIALDVGVVQRLEHGNVTDQTLFFDSVGWGWQPDILVDCLRDKTVIARLPVLRNLYKGQMVYAGAIVKRALAACIHAPYFDATLTIDGSKHVATGLMDIIISTSAVYGGAWILDRGAKPNDGQFELITFQGRRELLLKGVRDLASLPVWQEHLDRVGVVPTCNHYGACFEVQFSRPSRPVLETQLDGERWHGGTHFRVEITPTPLRLIVRRGFVAPWVR